jgi:DNA repair exonuclease SbcCD ATPase subunit
MADRGEPSPDEFHSDTPQDNGERVKRARPVIGFLLVLAITGVGSAFAWRAYADRPWLAVQEAQAGTLNELKAAVQQLENSQQQLLQRITALQTSQQQLERSRQVDVQRLSEQITAVSKEVEKTKAAAKQAASKRSSVADNKAKDSKLAQTSSVTGSQSASNPTPSGQR